ncbi:MAG: hypothetical protein EP329_08780 [Deltaproteobacteria bacterium]|nr:MAG: hypothetical protein EP329_08780 [Deltaproteobacteria bacterium]
MEPQGTRWEKVKMRGGPDLRRVRVPGGWLVVTLGGTSPPVAFYPDPEGRWAAGFVEDEELPGGQLTVVDDSK